MLAIEAFVLERVEDVEPSDPAEHRTGERQQGVRGLTPLPHHRQVSADRCDRQGEAEHQVRVVGESEREH